MTGADIRELGLLADLEAIGERYEQRFGTQPINLSLWNPAPSFVRDLDLNLPSAADLKGIDYIFSYDVPERSSMLRELGFEDTRGCLLTHSGSTAIVAAANWLRRVGCSTVLIIGPRYFTVPYTLTSFGIKSHVLHMQRSEDGVFSFPDIDNRLLDTVDALWLTNPVYCTGVRYDRGEVTNFISEMLSRDIRVVIDECLAEYDNRLGPRFQKAKVATIHAPHKAICVNGIKFAAVVFDSAEQDHFDSWCDVWNGCLPASSIVGLRHFLSPDFQRYRSEFQSAIALNHERVRGVAKTRSSIILDPDTSGYLISAYAPGIGADAGLDYQFLEGATFATGATFISGSRNEMSPSVGLSFRLNLAAIDIAALGAFGRLCDWLESRSLR